MSLQRRTGLLAGLVLLSCQSIAEPLSLLPSSEFSDYHNASKLPIAPDTVLPAVVIDAVFSEHQLVSSPDNLIISCPLKKRPSVVAPSTRAGDSSGASKSTHASEYQCTSEVTEKNLLPASCSTSKSSDSVKWYKSAGLLYKISKEKRDEALPCIEELFRVDRATAIQLHLALLRFQSDISTSDATSLIRDALLADNTRRNEHRVEPRSFHIAWGAEEQARTIVEAYLSMLSRASLIDEVQAQDNIRLLQQFSGSSDSLRQLLYQVTHCLESYIYLVDSSGGFISIYIQPALLQALHEQWTEEFQRLLRRKPGTEPLRFIQRVAKLISDFKIISPYALCNDATIHGLTNFLFWHHGISPSLASPEELDSFHPEAIENTLLKGLQEPGSACKKYRASLVTPTKPNEYTDFNDLSHTK